MLDESSFLSPKNEIGLVLGIDDGPFPSKKEIGLVLGIDDGLFPPKKDIGFMLFFGFDNSSSEFSSIAFILIFKI